jgi:hypothetical protein
MIFAVATLLAQSARCGDYHQIILLLPVVIVMSCRDCEAPCNGFALQPQVVLYS